MIKKLKLLREELKKEGLSFQILMSSPGSGKTSTLTRKLMLF